MSETVIHARDLTKVYRLYASPRYRFLDMFGMLRNTAGAYTEHAALGGVSLDIRRGEKVAFIGRNGAGKSTLLKLFTGVIEPTSGTLAVTGKAHALLQIGSGFHPDFTGRENVYAYLAQLGVSGREADRKFAEIVEFAELEEYIGQPVKTYSSGMAVRLMFSTSTAISPDLLVLDEVLGVGDAYFANKSYERIRELCERDGTTLLLVTHDVYSAAKICRRIIWIDHGRVLMDDDGPRVIKAYEDSIRQQEEERLRVRKIQRLDSEGSARPSANPRHVLLEIHARQNQPQPVPVEISRLELTVAGHRFALPWDAEAFDESRSHRLQKEPGCWGPAVDVDDRPARAFLNYGSPFHKVAGVVSLPEGLDLEATGFAVEVDYKSAAPCDLLLMAFVGSTPIELGALPASHGEWVSHAATFDASIEARERVTADVINATGVNGTGVIAVEDVSLADANGHPVHVVRHGTPVQFLIRFRVADPTLKERAQVVIAIHRDGVLPACRFVARNLAFDASQRPTGTVSLFLDRLMLGIGNYSVSVMIAAEGYLDREQVVFYSLNRQVYASHSRAMEFTVTGEGEGLTPTNIVFVGDGKWTFAGQERGE